MSSLILKKSDIESEEVLFKTHFLNKNAQRINKSLGDLTGLTGFGIHLIEVPVGKESTELHTHHFEAACEARKMYFRLAALAWLWLLVLRTSKPR